MNISSLNQEPDDELYLSDYWKILMRHKAIIVVCFLVLVVAALFVTAMTTPAYKSAVTLFIDQESNNVVSISENNLLLGTDNYAAYKEYFQSQKEIMRGRRILEQVFDELNLKEMPEYIPQPKTHKGVFFPINRVIYKVMRDVFKIDFPVESQTFSSQPEPIEKFMNLVRVSEVPNTRLLRLEVEQGNPEIAAKIANRIAEIYVAQNLAYISKDELLTLQKNEYLRLQAKLSELSKIYKNGHPQIIRLKEKINEVTGQITQELDNTTVDGKPKILTTDFSSLKVNNVSVQDWAKPNYKPIRPDRRKNLLLSIIIGLAIGVALAFLKEALDNTVKNARDVQRLVNWPFLGYIPRIRCWRKKSLSLLVHRKPTSAVTETFRSIRTSVLFSSTESRQIKCILVTSPGKAEGKSMVAVNLAIALAKNEKRVLLVDADMRKPRLHKVFGKRSKLGLNRFVADEALLHEIVNETKIENLSVVFSRKKVINASELLASDGMGHFIKIAKERFDYIILDAPPALIVTDAVILSKIVDGTIVVLESGKTLRKVISALHAKFQSANAHLLGFVLNKVKARTDIYS